MKKWLGYQFATGVEPSESYKKFQAAAKRNLKKIANESGFDLHSFREGHFEFSAVLEQRESGRFIYVAITDVRFFSDKWYNHVLVRTMAHDKDWTGGFNNYCEWPEIGETAQRLCR